MRFHLTAVTIVIFCASISLATLPPTPAGPATPQPAPVSPGTVKVPHANNAPPTVNAPPAIEKKKKACPAKKSKHKKEKRERARSKATTQTEESSVVTPNAEKATQTPSRAMSSQSKTIYDYMPDAIYRIYGSPLHLVDVQLQPGELIQGKIAAGDTVRWTIGIVAHGAGLGTTQHVLIKPESAGLETNLIITTDKHSYHLSAKSDAKYYVPTVGWNYPQEEMAALQRVKAEEKRLLEQVAAPGIKAENLNFKYKIKGDDEYPWTPVRVFDDGTKTFIQMNPQMKNYQAPVLFIKNRDGLNLVNYRVKGDYYIVDRLFGEAELRSGKKDVVKIEREDKRGFWPW